MEVIDIHSTKHFFTILVRFLPVCHLSNFNCCIGMHR